MISSGILQSVSIHMPERTLVYRRTDESSSSDEDLTAKQTPVPVHTDPAPAGGGVSYQKTLRLSSEQLVSILNLINFYLFINKNLTL